MNNVTNTPSQRFKAMPIDSTLSLSPQWIQNEIKFHGHTQEEIKARTQEALEAIENPKIKLFVVPVMRSQMESLIEDLPYQREWWHNRAQSLRAIAYYVALDVIGAKA